MRMIRDKRFAVLTTGIALVWLLQVGAANANAASASAGTAFEASAAPPVESDRCGCGDLAELIVLIFKRFAMPLPTLPPPPGTWIV